MSLPELHPDAIRPLTTTSTDDTENLDSEEYLVRYVMSI